MQVPGLYYLFKLALQPNELFINGTPVGFDLGLPRPTDETQPAPLALKVCPGPDEARSLIGKCGHFDLQDPFAGRRAVREYFKNKPRCDPEVSPSIRVPGCAAAPD